MRDRKNTKYWNYRFLKQDIYKNDKIINTYYSLIEVYYGDDGNIAAYNDDLSNITVTSIKDCKEFLKQIELAYKNPIMKFVDKKLTDTTEFMRKEDL